MERKRMKNPSGICRCGCGQPTPLSKKTRRGYKRGDSLLYIRGHSSRKKGPDYREEDHGMESACWIWQKYCNQDGYSCTWDGERVVHAHRLYYEAAIGPIPEGMELHHLCEQPACVNPDHLLLCSRRAHMAMDGRNAFGNPRAKVELK